MDDVKNSKARKDLANDFSCIARKGLKDRRQVLVTIKNKVHELYWKYDVNCAGTMLICLGELLGVEYQSQTLDCAVGMHGAGGFRAQCGLVEGSLMFLGIYGKQKGKSQKNIEEDCYRFADLFQKKFGSLNCCDLRPNGFQQDDPPHLCESLTCEAVEFTYRFLSGTKAF